MRRGSSKKSGQSNPSVNSSAADLFRSASSKANSKELERIDSLFYTYANGSSGLIDPSTAASCTKKTRWWWSSELRSIRNDGALAPVSCNARPSSSLLLNIHHFHVHAVDGGFFN
ncbi:unnamed protein product [Trifolium pratense]|uniref:Uncharacterized protein n=1 Tax=Trifolium pratense TaxID=57577 RepID=A0ACB0L297_TRIPR|nr:unnamed protein product [Trifolium pratense]